MDGSFEPRVEDHRLLTGAGNFQDDEATAGAAWGVFVRSPHAFADIRGIDIASAQAMPGVLAVVTAAALDVVGIGSVSVPVPVPGSHGMVSPHRPSLARDCVRHVGEHSFHKHPHLPRKGNGVTHVSGTICHLCLGPLTYLQLTAGLRAKVGFANINAKGIESKPAFREAFQRRRCLVPVDNFYE